MSSGTRAGGWRRLMPWASVLVAGPLTLLGFAPFSVPILPLAGPALLYLAVRDAPPGRAFLLGWCYALGFALPGMFWVRRLADSMNFADSGPALLVALIVIASLVAVHGLGAALFAWLRRGVFAGGGGAALLFAALWFVAEVARGQAAIGIPAWLAIGYAQIDVPLAGWAPVIGVHGVSFLAMLSVVLAVTWRRRWRGLIAAALIWSAGAGLQRVDWTADAGPAIAVALVQRGTLPRIREPADGARNLALLAGLHARAAERADLVVWAESSLGETGVSRPDAPFLAALDRDLTARGKHLLFNLIDIDSRRRTTRNALVGLGGPASRYDKRILAPFGEWLPRGAWIDPAWHALGLYYDSWLMPGDAARPLIQAGSWAVGVAICYEIAFGDPLRAALPDAAFLVTIANDSWFDGTLEPAQHLEIARMRALETRRWLLRAALSGHTAIIAPSGAIVRRLPTGSAGVLEGAIVPRTGATPYVRYGNWPLLLFCGVVLLATVINRFDRRIEE